MRIVLVRALARRRRAGAVLMGSAVRWIRLVVRMAGFVVVAVTGGVAFAVISSTRFRMAGVIRQFADFVAFAGPEKDKSDGRRKGGHVTENRAHRPHSRHRV